MKAQIFQHEPFEGPFAVLDWLNENGFEVSFTRFYENPVIPSIGETDWLIVMGGGMSVNDEHIYPWLKPEKEFIRNMIGAGKPVVGICLGSQLIANSLGYKVYPAKNKEIGWFPVFRTGHDTASLVPEKIHVCHWHGETFDLPEGARLIASSEACTNQIFIFGKNVLAMQCHLEMTPEAVAGMFDNCCEDLKPAAFVQSLEEIETGTEKFSLEANQLLFSLLNKLKEEQFSNTSA